MTPDERQQSLENARIAYDWLTGYLTGDMEHYLRERIVNLMAGFKLLDDKEQNQIKAGGKGGKFGKLGGRPRKNGGEK